MRIFNKHNYLFRVEIRIYDAKHLENNDANPALLKIHQLYLDVGESRTVIFQEKSTYDVRISKIYLTILSCVIGKKRKNWFSTINKKLKDA